VQGIAPLGAASTIGNSSTSPTEGDRVPTKTEARITAQLNLALCHPSADNRHLRRVVRWSNDPRNAAAATRTLDAHNGGLAAQLDRAGHLDDYSVLGLLFRLDVEAVLPDGNPTLVDRAFDRAVQRYAGLHPNHGLGVPEHVAADPVGTVRAAYVLARDLATARCDDSAGTATCLCRRASD
jgi:hypothetical protein